MPEPESETLEAHTAIAKLARPGVLTFMVATVMKANRSMAGRNHMRKAG